MPAQYVAMKRSYSKAHPDADEKDVKKHAAMEFIGAGKGGSRHSRAMALAADRKPKVKKRPVAFGEPK